MKLAIIGTGYVGLPTGVGMAELGHEVVCIDREESKIRALQAGQTTLYEEGLEELLHKNQAEGRITFTTSMKEGVKDAEAIMVAVGTPPHPITKEADMRYVHSAAIELAKYLTNYAVVIIKSTVPVGTGDEVEYLILETSPDAQFDVVSVPEFLREGYAVHDFFSPDRIIIGTNSERPQPIIRKLYEPLEGKTKMLFVRRQSSELIKYASNAFLAMKIHYINEMADFCEKTDANIKEISEGMGLDTRIGDRFLNPGPGYGGSCFPKDTLAMAHMARANGVDLTLIETTIEQNKLRKKKIATKIRNSVRSIPSPKIAILGLAFKEGTDDCRDSPAVEIITELLDDNIKITAYDPKATENAKLLLGDKIEYASSMYEAMENADLLVILTEWKDFQKLDLAKANQSMRTKNIMDCRNLLNPKNVQELGFNYSGIGL